MDPAADPSMPQPAARDWLTKNLARSMKRVKVDSKPTGYFTRDEFGRIIDATHAYGDWIGGHDFHHGADRLFLKFLRGLPSANPRSFFWSGNGDPHTAKKVGSAHSAACSS
jgi:hypothetical protein